jgi:hypothetical protein
VTLSDRFTEEIKDVGEEHEDLRVSWRDCGKVTFEGCFTEEIKEVDEEPAKVKGI